MPVRATTSESKGFLNFMETKCCSVCKEQKPKSEFTVDKSSKDKLGYRCFLCRKEYRSTRKEKIVAYNKQYRVDNRERRRLYNIDYISKNQEKMKLAEIKYKKENSEKIKERQKSYYSKPEVKEIYKKRSAEYEKTEKAKERRRIYREKNKHIYREATKKYNDKNRSMLTEKHRKRMKTDPIYRLKRKIRDAIKNALRKKGYSKSGPTQKILGCDYDFFIQYIESQFKKGMTWENATIDHIKPLKSAKTEEEVLLLNHYTNLQPMFGPDNSSKKDKLITKQLRLI